MARNSRGQTVKTLQLIITVTADGDPANYDWETIIAHGADLSGTETVEVLSAIVVES